MLVRNEDLFVERALRSVAAFCDRIHAVDHVSDDGTWGILQRLAGELDHLDVRRSARAGDSHAVLEHYAGTPTWVLRVDGDELHDPAKLASLRRELRAGACSDVFRVLGHVLNCDELDLDARIAAGHMSPPSRQGSKLFNFAALESWTGAIERLHGGDPVFRSGRSWDSWRNLAEETTWDDDPLRCLHVCFLARSSGERDPEQRQNLNETGAFDRSAVAVLKRRVRPYAPPPKVAELHRSGRTWKHAYYRRGERVTVDASPFLDAG